MLGLSPHFLGSTTLWNHCWSVGRSWMTWSPNQRCWEHSPKPSTKRWVWRVISFLKVLGMSGVSSLGGSSLGHSSGCQAGVTPVATGFGSGESLAAPIPAAEPPSRSLGVSCTLPRVGGDAHPSSSHQLWPKGKEPLGHQPLCLCWHILAGEGLCGTSGGWPWDPQTLGELYRWFSFSS